MNQNGDYLRVGEVARRLHVPLEKVFHWVRIGQLKGHKEGHRLWISRQEVMRFMRQLWSMKAQTV